MRQIRHRARRLREDRGAPGDPSGERPDGTGAETCGGETVGLLSPETVYENLGTEEDCPYLAGERSRMRYRQIDSCTAEIYEGMLERGWRRFGSLFFRPGCRACLECRSLRVQVDEFRPGRSMRRTRSRNRDLRVLLRRPAITAAHLDLYERYHQDMAERRGWPAKSIESFEYYVTFVQGARDYGWEMVYLLEDRLVAVALVDILPKALSAVYCYYEPQMRRRGLGVFSILRQIDLARVQGRPHLYLGYWVVGNPSMRYKSDYSPHQLLHGRPELNERPLWV